MSDRNRHPTSPVEAFPLTPMDNTESFIPFDLESTWSCAVVFLVTNMVDPSLLRRNESWLQKTHSILDEMVSRGNLVAGLRKAELQQLDETLTRLHTTTTSSTALVTTTSTHDANVLQQQQQQPFEGDGPPAAGGAESVQDVGSCQSQMQFEPLQDWNSEEGLSGDQLIAVADWLDFSHLDWLSAAPLGQLESY